MRSYSMGELESLLGEKAHVLRYWERVIPQLSPRRSESGRRTYSETEVLAFLRVKHLVRRRGYAPDAVRELLLREASGPRQDLFALAGEVRAVLVRSYFHAVSSLPPPGKAGARPGAVERPASRPSGFPPSRAARPDPRPSLPASRAGDRILPEP